MMIHMLQVLAVQAARRCLPEKSSVKLSSRKVLSFVGFADVLSGKLMMGHSTRYVCYARNTIQAKARLRNMIF